MKRLKSQAEPIAVIILTTVGLVIALLTWSWVNARLAPVTTQAMLQQYLAFERSREYATLIASGVNQTMNTYEYIVDLMHIIVTNRRWFAFVVLAGLTNQTGLIDPSLTEEIQSSYGNGFWVYTLVPTSGYYVYTTRDVKVYEVDARDVILADGRSLYDYGVNGTVYVFVVPEYYSGLGDPTPDALVDIQVEKSMLPATSRLILVTLTSFNNRWYEVTRLILS